MKNLAKAELLTQVKAHSFSIYLIYVVRMVTCCIRSCLSVIFQVRVVLTWTVVVVDRRFDNLSGGQPTLKISSAQVVETSVNNTKSLSQDYLHPQDHTLATYVTPRLKPLTIVLNLSERKLIHLLLTSYVQKIILQV